MNQITSRTTLTRQMTSVTVMNQMNQMASQTAWTRWHNKLLKPADDGVINTRTQQPVPYGITRLLEPASSNKSVMPTRAHVTPHHQVCLRHFPSKVECRFFFFFLNQASWNPLCSSLLMPGRLWYQLVSLDSLGSRVLSEDIKIRVKREKRKRERRKN